MAKRKSRKAKRQFPARPYRALIFGHFYRMSEAWLYFGYRPNQLTEKIKTGEIPPPVSLTDSGRAKGWFGQQIMNWQSERQQAAARGNNAA